MVVAGGAALHFYTGERISRDIDAAFSARVVLPNDLEIAYTDPDGAARLLYLDRQYSDSLSLLHEDAEADSVALPLPGINPEILDLRLLAPVDLAVSKLSRFAEHDRMDIAALGRRGLIEASALERRATEALAAYVGNDAWVRGSIDVAVRIVADAASRSDPLPSNSMPLDLKRPKA
jgi:hypothetical protein